MEYSKIISVTGLGGLYELLSSKNDGAIVRSLDDNTTKFVSSRIHNFSHLESIEVYTVRDNVNLVEIFHAMENASDPLPDEKNNDAVKKYFHKVFPDLDFERVYASDMKKMTKWFSILKKNDVTIELSEPEEEPVEEPAPAPPAPKKEKAEKVDKPVKKTEEPKEEKKKPKEEKKESKPKAEKKEAKPAAKKSAAKEPAKKAAKEAPKKSAKSESGKSTTKKKSGK
ncbi:MAG: hypothetical protein C5B52_05775 [Bacteroidetes bacterium]|nr:MAG: hypothetical protein C5B52_05775 [Bacteroidota bacterium]